MVIQDLLCVFVIRIACHNAKYASMLIEPVLSSVVHHVSESSCPSDTDLDFLASLLEHPLGKVVLIFYLLFPLFLSLMFIRIIVMNLVLLTIVDC